MKSLIVSVFLLINTCCFAQGDVIVNKISAADSLALLQSMGSLIKAVESKDEKLIMDSSLELVYCETCLDKISFDHMPQDGFIKSHDLKTFLVDWLRTSPAWIDIKQYMPSMASTSGKGYAPKSVTLKPEDYFTEFELSYNIEASSNKCVFSFTKQDGKFKIWAVRLSP